MEKGNEMNEAKTLRERADKLDAMIRRARRMSMRQRNLNGLNFDLDTAAAAANTMRANADAIERRAAEAKAKAERIAELEANKSDEPTDFVGLLFGE